MQKCSDMRKEVNQTKHGLNCIRYENAKIWNHLPDSFKAAENLQIFKRLIKNWQGVNCGCSICEKSD